jgi:hypothetical protein
MVPSGAKAHLTWNISYPDTARDLLLFDASGRVTTKDDLRVQMRVAGVAFEKAGQELPVAFWASFNSAPWQELFYGFGSHVQPDHFVYDQVVPANTTIDFGARGGKADGTWYDSRQTTTSDTAVVGLVDGQPVPDYAPAYQQGQIKDYLTGLVGTQTTEAGESETVATIGPRDMIYLFELASRNQGDWYFDMQDLVVVLTFERIASTEL